MRRIPQRIPLPLPKEKNRGEKMISVVIFINNQPIFCRTAVNIKGDEICDYKLDTGEIIKHKRSDGAVVLAKKMLETIHEVK